MYNLVKPRGSTSNITLTNTDSHVTISLGAPTTHILHILSSSEDFASVPIDSYAEWAYLIGKETAQNLVNSTTMKKVSTSAAATTSASTEQTKPTVNNNKNIDAMDVLLGLAQYN